MVGSALVGNEKPTSAIDDAPVFDSVTALAALERDNGDQELLTDIAGMFLSDYPGLMFSIKEAYRTRDYGALGLAAHTLKGMVSNFYARPASDAAQRLEIVAEKRDLKGSNEALVALEMEVERLSGAIKLFLEGQTQRATIQ